VTGGRGVDVIINSLVGDLMHATWSCIAPFGRFVEIGKRELIDAGKLDMREFLKGSTSTGL
jgi:NADPH:quinone reductase-like Zn-dependent oxidoreductase